MERAKILKEKEVALQQKAVRKKERLTANIMTYGLWQCEHDAKLKTKTEKLQALKAHLEFRKKMLEQTSFDKTYSNSPSGYQYKRLVCKLFSTPELSSSTHESLVGRRIRHCWCNADGTEQ